MGWLLISSEPAPQPGRSKLTFQIDGYTRRIVYAWGCPPDEEHIYRLGSMLEQEEHLRPVAARYHLGEGA